VKVAIYVRVSKIDQNPENQRIELENYARRMGWDYEIFEEKESTRKTRPVQSELYNRFLRKEFDGLLIWKFDRWARSTGELIEHMENFMERDIGFFSYMENLDLKSSMGRAMFTIISVFAQLKRDSIKERTMAGLERARAQGKKLGRPLKSGKLYRKPALMEVARLHSRGQSIREIARQLETSKYWVEYSINEIQRNPDKFKGVSF
jgi:DNA invertase Pin-like site-specific DNA recombinase